MRRCSLQETRLLGTSAITIYVRNESLRIADSLVGYPVTPWSSMERILRGSTVTCKQSKVNHSGRPESNSAQCCYGADFSDSSEDDVFVDPRLKSLSTMDPELLLERDDRRLLLLRPLTAVCCLSLWSVSS